MKKIVGLITLFLMFSVYIVIAGDILKLDFSEKNQQLVGFKEGDAAEFYLNGERNIIIISKIKPTSVDITVFVAQETNGYPYYTTLSKDRSLKLDVERDDIDDLYVGYFKSDENLKYVYIIMEKPENPSPTGYSILNKIKRGKREYDKYIIAGFVFALILLIILNILYKRKE